MNVLNLAMIELVILKEEMESLTFDFPTLGDFTLMEKREREKKWRKKMREIEGKLCDSSHRKVRGSLPFERLLSSYNMFVIMYVHLRYEL